jgi:hypothetical protein
LHMVLFYTFNAKIQNPDPIFNFVPIIEKKLGALG